MLEYHTAFEGHELLGFRWQSGYPPATRLTKAAASRAALQITLGARSRIWTAVAQGGTTAATAFDVLILSRIPLVVRRREPAGFRSQAEYPPATRLTKAAASRAALQITPGARSRIWTAVAQGGTSAATAFDVLILSRIPLVVRRRGPAGFRSQAEYPPATRLTKAAASRAALQITMGARSRIWTAVAQRGTSAATAFDVLIPSRIPLVVRRRDPVGFRSQAEYQTATRLTKAAASRAALQITPGARSRIWTAVAEGGTSAATAFDVLIPSRIPLVFRRREPVNFRQPVTPRAP